MTADHLLRGTRWRERAAELLGSITERLAVPSGRKPARGEFVMIDGWAVRRSDQCLASFKSDDEYVETAKNARRRVGRAVLGRLRQEPSLDPVTAFEQALAEPDAWFDERLVDWLEALGTGGRAALAAEACGYAAAFSATVAPDRLSAVRLAAPAEHLDWTVPGRAVKVRGDVEALTPLGARPPGRRLLVVGSLERADLVAAHAALAYTLNTASVPARVTVLDLARGKDVVTVDDDLLEAALGRVGAAAHAAVSARFGPAAAATAGAWCCYCGRADECETGKGWIASNPVRIGGLLPLR